MVNECVAHVARVRCAMRTLTVSQRFPLASVHSASAAAACAADVDGRPAASSRRRRWSMSCVPARRTAARNKRIEEEPVANAPSWSSNSRRQIRPPWASLWCFCSSSSGQFPRKVAIRGMFASLVLLHRAILWTLSRRATYRRSSRRPTNPLLLALLSLPSAETAGRSSRRPVALPARRCIIMRRPARRHSIRRPTSARDGFAILPHRPRANRACS